MANEDLLKILEERRPGFSKSQKRIADFIIEHYEKAAYMTALKLGGAVGVSESTVVRFAIELGFEGYPQLRRSLQAHIKNRLTNLQRMDVTQSRMGGNDPVAAVLTQDIDKIRRTIDSVDRAAFAAAVDAIVAANRIYVQGAMSSGLLATFMHYNLRLIFDKTTLIGSVNTSELYQQMIHIGEGDLLIAMSFPRYAASTLKACEFARDSGAKILAITDGDSSPLAHYADIALYAYSDMVSFADSLVAPMSLINAIIAEAAARSRAGVEQTFAKLEQLWDSSAVYKTVDK